MPSTSVDVTYFERLKLAASAEWLGTPSVREPAAKAFTPPGAALKPVLYLPVKRQEGKVKWPFVTLWIGLREEGTGRLSFEVPAWTGAEVKINVKNMWKAYSGTAKHLKLKGKLDKTLTCSVNIDAKTLEDWLKPDGDMEARINENLLDFDFEVKVGDKTYKGEATNRIHLFRKKTIVFLPGVFGSQIEVKSTDGETMDAFPNFFEAKNWWKGLILIGKAALEQEIGVLESDADGKPLLEANEPRLLTMGGFVYDTADVCEEGYRKHFRDIPAGSFQHFPLAIFAYDWRGDLTDMAKDMIGKLKALQKRLRARPDTDDEVAIAGHSTGGVIIRRMLGDPDAEKLISHAFFLNVPFRGAPKAMAVFLTGCDPPGGGSMIPFITKGSLRAISAIAPIVYHLAPSFKYPEWLADIEGKRPSGGPDEEKAALVQGALDRGGYFPRMVVDPALASDDAKRKKLAKGSDEWAGFWEEYELWKLAAPPFDKAFPGGTSEYHWWESRRLKGESVLNEQGESRTPQGWSEKLAGNARKFHEESEKAAASGKWKEKAYIFYSKAEKPTTGGAYITKVSETSSLDYKLLTGDVSRYLTEGTARPGRRQVDDAFEWEEWAVEGKNYIKRVWRLSVTSTAGDSTVPLVSLLGFGGDAKVFKPIPGNPEHVPAPNSVWLWTRMLEVLQGYDVSKHLNTTADPKAGKE